MIPWIITTGANSQGAFLCALKLKKFMTSGQHRLLLRNGFSARQGSRPEMDTREIVTITFKRATLMNGLGLVTPTMFRSAEQFSKPTEKIFSNLFSVKQALSASR